MVRYNLQQRVFLYDTHVKYGSVGKCRRKSRRKFREERVLSRQTIHNLVNKLRTTGLLTDKKTKHKRRVLTKEK
jgi:transposase